LFDEFCAGRRPTPAQHIDYEIRYVNGKLEGKMIGGKNLTFTGERAPVIEEHDDGTWVKGTPIVLFNGKDLTGWTGIRKKTPKALNKLATCSSVRYSGRHCCLCFISWSPPASRPSEFGSSATQADCSWICLSD